MTVIKQACRNADISQVILKVLKAVDHPLQRNQIFLQLYIRAPISTTQIEKTLLSPTRSL